MFLLTLGEIREAVGGKVFEGFNPKIRISGISIDSRTIKKDEIFFAIKGEKFDGAKFVDAALKNGASAVIVSGAKKGKNVINVSDTNKALMVLALYYRKRRHQLINEQFFMAGFNNLNFNCHHSNYICSLSG